MGLFSGSKKVYVSSVVYNMAGDENTRPNFLKTNVIGSVMNGDPSLGETMTTNYLTGPGIKLRQFGRWARNSGYSEALGLSSANSYGNANINRAVIASTIPHAGDETVDIQYADIGVANYSYWVDQWLVENRPEKLEDNYVVDFKDDIKQVTITYSDSTTDVFTITGFDPSKRYLYTGYTLIRENIAGAPVMGPVRTADTNSDFPSLVGWNQQSKVDTPGSVDMVNTTKVRSTYSDARPPEESTTTSTTPTAYVDYAARYTRTEYQGEDPITKDLISVTYELLISKVHKKKITVTEDTVTETIAGGVVKTTVTTVTTESLDYGGTYQENYVRTILKSWSNIKISIYEEGSGNPALDAMFPTPGAVGSYFPFIPIRIDNRFIEDGYYDELLPLVQKATRKSIKSRFSEIVAKIEDNPSLKDIDYAYLVFGVSINVKENACRRYIYEFFQNALLTTGPTVTAYQQWRTLWLQAKASQDYWDQWRNDQTDDGLPLFGDPEPAIIPYPVLPSYRVQVSSSGGLNYNLSTIWSGLEESVGIGKLKPDAKVGDVWFEYGGSEEFIEKIRTESQVFESTFSVENVLLKYQETANTWRVLSFYGLKSQNMIYGGKSVDISAWQGISDADESGFIIPLHEESFKSTALVQSTQMSTACVFLVFNCYQVVRQKWYQTGFFKLFIVIVVIVISIYFPPAGGASAGILGTSAAVGATLGFTGMAALIVGAAANAIAAMLLTSVISKTSTMLFGEKLGAIIGTIASIMAMQIGTSLATNQAWSASFSQLLKADNIMKLSMSAAKGVTEYMQAVTNEIVNSTNQLVLDYKNESQKVAEAYAREFGNTGVLLDPATIAESANLQYESPESFFERTLMVGSDVAEMSLNMLSDFAEITTTPNLEG